MTSTNHRHARPTTGRKAVAATAAGALILGMGGAIVAATSAQADTTVTEGSFNWGFRESFRNYVGNQTGAIPPVGAAPVGTRIVPTAPATFDAAAAPSTVGNDETKPYIFPVTGTSVATTTNLTVAADGAVVYSFPSHAFTITISDPKLVVTGATKSIEADVNVVIPANTVGQTPGTYGGDDIVIGDVTTLDTVMAGDAKSATVTGSGVTLTAAGASALQNFLTAGAALDDFTASVVLSDPAPAAPAVTVSKTVVNPATDTITVTGTGFDASTTLGTRPPLLNQPAGTYVVFGKFAPVWKPSAGAPSTARKAMTVVQGGQKWAVPAGSIAGVGGSGAGAIELAPDGSFTATLSVKRDFTTGLPTPGNYGVYTYPGAGATNAAFETFTPISFQAATASAPGTPSVVSGGSSVNVAGTGFNAGETVNVVLHSTPVTIGTLIADSTGAVSGSVVIPNGTEAGAHQIVLEGVTSGVSAVAASISVPGSLTAFQTITTEVVHTGALTISVDDNSVVLPSPELTSDAMAIETSGALNPITVADLRTADPGWSLTGTLTDFAAGSATFDGDLLEWTPKKLTNGAGQVVNPGAVATGLTGGKVLASAPAGQGRGSAQVGADLHLVLPTTTDPGVYVATLTLTAV